MTGQLKKYIDVAKVYVKELKKSGVPVSSAYIFGSRVKGTNHKWSDLDTGIISEKFGRNQVRERVRLMSVGNRVSDLIEPHPFSPTDFNDRHNILAAEIKKTGLRVV